MTQSSKQALQNVKDHLDDYNDFLGLGSMANARRSLQNMCDAIADLASEHADVLHPFQPAAAIVAPTDLEKATGTLRAELSLANTLGRSLTDELFLHGNAEQQRRIASELNAAISRASIRSRALLEAVTQ